MRCAMLNECRCLFAWSHQPTDRDNIWLIMHMCRVRCQQLFLQALSNLLAIHSQRYAVAGLSVWQPNAAHSAQRATSAVLATRKMLSRRAQPLRDATNMVSLPLSVGAVHMGRTTPALPKSFPDAAAPTRLVSSFSFSPDQQAYATPPVSRTTAEAAPLATPDSAFMALCAIPLVQITPVSVAGHGADNFSDLLTSQSSFPSGLLGSGLGSPLGSPPDSFDRSLLSGTWGQDLTNVTGEDAMTSSAALAELSFIDSAPQMEQLDGVDATCSAMVAAAIGL